MKLNCLAQEWKRLKPGTLDPDKSSLRLRENAASFLRLGLPSVHTNPSRKRSYSKALFKPDEFENAGFDYGLLWTENILKTKVFKNDYLRLDNHVINPNPQGCSQALLRW